MALRLCLRSSWFLAASAPVCFCAIPTGTAPVCFPAVHTRLSVPFSALGTFGGSPRPARPPGSFPGTRFAGKLIDGHRRRTRLPPHHRPPGSPPLVCGGTGDVVGVSLPLPLCPPRPPTGCPGRLRPAFARGCAVPRFRRMRGLRHRCLVHRKALLFSPPVPTAGRHS